MNTALLQNSQPALDPRRNAFRDDLAAQHLRDTVDAPRYAEGRPAQVMHPTVALRRFPDVLRGFETEAVFGDAVTVYDEADGWAWVQLARDGYVGYIPTQSLREGALITPTHRVQALGTFVYATPDIKAPPLMMLPLNAMITVTRGNGHFVELETGGFVVARHVAPLDRPERDFVEIAERMIGTPYLWGGCTRIGIDCSGLVQTSLLASQIVAPRDSDMQQAELGAEVAINPEFDDLVRGDLVFWSGHVGIMCDGVMMVHANAHHMMVAVEPLSIAAARISKTGAAVLAIKRLGGGSSDVA